MTHFKTYAAGVLTAFGIAGAALGAAGTAGATPDQSGQHQTTHTHQAREGFNLSEIDDKDIIYDPAVQRAPSAATPDTAPRKPKPPEAAIPPGATWHFHHPHKIF